MSLCLLCRQKNFAWDGRKIQSTWRKLEGFTRKNCTCLQQTKMIFEGLLLTAKVFFLCEIIVGGCLWIHIRLLILEKNTIFVRTKCKSLEGSKTFLFIKNINYLAYASNWDSAVIFWRCSNFHKKSPMIWLRGDVNYVWKCVHHQNMSMITQTTILCLWSLSIHIIWKTCSIANTDCKCGLQETHFCGKCEGCVCCRGFVLVNLVKLYFSTRFVSLLSLIPHTGEEKHAFRASEDEPKYMMGHGNDDHTKWWSCRVSKTCVCLLL